MKFRAIVDINLCQGHGQCEDTAPNYFEVREDALAHVLRDVETPEGLELVREACSRCPASAISMIELHEGEERG